MKALKKIKGAISLRVFKITEGHKDNSFPETSKLDVVDSVASFVSH